MEKKEEKNRKKPVALLCFSDMFINFINIHEWKFHLPRHIYCFLLPIQVSSKIGCLLKSTRSNMTAIYTFADLFGAVSSVCA